MSYSKIDSVDAFHKVAVIGASAVGKSQLLNRIQRNDFRDEYFSTNGSQFCVHDESVGEKVVRLQLWDISSSDRGFPHDAFYRSVTGIMVVLDLSNKDSLKIAHEIITQVKQSKIFFVGPSPAIVLVGNKHDLQYVREVSDDEFNALAQEHDIRSFIVSAKDNKNIDFLLNQFARALTNFDEPNPELSNEQKALIDYIEQQMDRIPKRENKFKNFSALLEEVRTKPNEMLSHHKHALSIASQHRDRGVLGFFKGVWLRNTQSENEYYETFGYKPQR